jgi:hypothetical protein
MRSSRKSLGDRLRRRQRPGILERSELGPEHKEGGNVTEREVAVGFMGQTSTQRVVLRPKKSVELVMTRGPLKGSRQIRLTPLENGKKTKVDISWAFEFLGVPDFARPFVRAQMERGTK